MPIFRGKNFVSSSSDYKDSVRVALRSNFNLQSSPTIIDGVTLSDKDRALVCGQSNQSENGIYVWSVSTGLLTRAQDADSSFELSSGNRIYVEEGNNYARSNWVLVTTGVITPGVTNIVFSKEGQVGTSNLSGTYGSSSTATILTIDESGQILNITSSDIAVDGGEY